MASISLDFGHGGRDTGAVGHGLQEKDINLNVGLAVGEILERHDVNVVYTRESDVFVELEERASIANRADTDIFVSIHTNGFEDPSAQGFVTFSYPTSSRGAELAESIHNEVIADETLYTVDRGTKTEKFLVLRETVMPAALVELAFITNSEDSEILRTRQDDFALAIAKGILKYFNIEYEEVQESTSWLRRAWEWLKTRFARWKRK